LVFTKALDRAELTRLQEIAFPVVLLHQSPQKDLANPVITIENQSGAQKVVDHLIDVHGCKCILFLQGREVIQALRKTGRGIPKDVAVAGFADSLFARILPPPITTVRAPNEHVGQAAARQLLRLIRSELVEARLVLLTGLIIRQSCGCSE